MFRNERYFSKNARAKNYWGTDKEHQSQGPTNVGDKQQRHIKNSSVKKGDDLQEK